MDVAREALIITDHTRPDEPILYVNRAFSELTGYAADEVLGRKCSFLQGEDRQQQELADLSAAIRAGRHHETTLRNYRKDGRLFLNRLSITPIESGGRVTHFFGFLSDVTEHVRRLDELRASETQFRTFAQAVPNHVWTRPAQGHIDWFNERFYAYTGKSTEELAHGGWMRLVHDADIDGALESWGRAFVSGDVYQHELRLRGADGQFRWFLTRALPLRNADGAITRWIGTSTDIDEQRSESARLAFLSSHDPLTGALNRHRIVEVLRERLRDPDDRRAHLAVLFVDLDRFKELNDVHGHALGDRLLKQVAQRFLQVLGSHNPIARFGGDEFLVLASASTQDRIMELAQAILAAAKADFEIDGNPYSLSASVGIAHYPEAGGNAESLICNADIAMYEAKLAGRGVARVFNPLMAARQAEKLQVSHELRQAITAGEMRLYYQPMFSLRTGALTGAEALVRWQHPRRGLLGADRFIAIAEESHSIVALGRWGLQQACTQLAQWDRQGLDVPRISVNLAARHLVDPSLPAFVSELLAQHRLQPQRLGVEVTESMVMSDVGVAGRVLGALHEMGVYIVLDDFGTGFSNITYLQNFWFDSLKIDKTFVQAIGTEREGHSAKLTQAVIAMSAALGLKTVAEGVETTAQLEFLRRHGCDAVQGFLFSPAVPAPSFASRFASPQPARSFFAPR